MLIELFGMYMHIHDIHKYACTPHYLNTLATPFTLFKFRRASVLNYLPVVKIVDH